MIFKTNSFKIILILLAGIVIVAFYARKTFSDGRLENNKDQVNAVLITPTKYDKTFGASVKNAKVFYDFFDEALEKIESKKYDAAIRILNDSLPHVGIIVERNMVYHELAKIYQLQGDLEQELKCLEAILNSIPKNAPASELKDKDYQRAAELRQLLAAKSQSSNPTT